MISIAPSGQACGATVTGVDLSKPLTAAETAEIRTAWLRHHVLAFPDQAMSDDDLERFTRPSAASVMTPSSPPYRAAAIHSRSKAGG